MYTSSISRVLALPALAFLLGPGAAAQCNPPVPQTFVVNDLRDLSDYDLTDNCCDGDMMMPGEQCTLRAAIQNANLFGGNVTIMLGPSVYTLTRWGTDDIAVWGDLDIFFSGLGRLEIRGIAGSTIIDASGFGAFPDRVFEVHTTVPATFELVLTDLTVTGGSGVSFGAGIRQEQGHLTLNNATISDNDANDKGGGIYFKSAGVLSATGGTIGFNTAIDGGGLYLESAAANVLVGTVFDQNNATQHGGGLRVAGGANILLTNVGLLQNSADSGGGLSTRGVAALDGCYVSGNYANGPGGGIFAAIGSGLSISGSNIAGNTAQIGGGLSTSNGGIVMETTFEQNQAFFEGGGINHSAGALTLQKCTLTTNWASAFGGGSGGGGIHALGLLLITNTTISGNYTQNNGGGGGLYIVGSQPHEIAATTIAFNSAPGGLGGGIRADNVFGPTSIALASTILSDNFAAAGTQNYSGATPLVSAGGNFDSDGTGVLILPNDRSGTLLNPVFAGLEPLMLNGGPTPTHGLLPGSPAIDRGVCHDVAGNAILDDQRSFPRSSPCDVGAFESAAGLQPGVKFCFGAGCPCGNDDPNLAGGCVNSAGTVAELNGSGSTSVFFDDLVLTTTGCPPNNTGLYFVGASSFPAVNVGDGLACTGGVFRYFPGVVSPGGSFVLTNPVANAFPGAVMHFQSWTRDVLCGPPPSPCASPCGHNSNLSNAYTVIFNP